MTVSSNQRRVTYQGDGVTRTFPVPYRFLERGDLRVVQADAAGNETVLALDIGFSVAGVDAPSGGSITATVAPAVGSRLVIKGAAVQQQPIDFTPFDPFPAEAQERGLDRVTIVVQEISATVGRALLIPEADAQFGAMTLPILTARAGTVLAFDAQGLPVAGPSASAIASLIATAYTPGLSALGDAVSFLAAGAGAVARSVQDRLRSHVELMDFIPNGLRDGIRAYTNLTVLTGYIAAAVAAAPAGAKIYVEPGLWTGTWSIAGNKRISIEGAGAPATMLRAAVSGNVIIDVLGDADASRSGQSWICNLAIEGGNLGSVTGIRGGVPGNPALLHFHVHGVSIQGCYAGLELGNVQESSFSKIASQRNTVGYLLETSPTDAGCTALTFDECSGYINEIGFFAKSNSIFPMGNWAMNKCVFQGNRICGRAFIGAVGGMGVLESVKMDVSYGENNGIEPGGGGSPVNATITVRGVVVPRCGVYLAGAKVNINTGEAGESRTDMTSFVLRNNASLTLRDVNLGGGSKLQVDADITSRVFLDGQVVLNGTVQQIADWNGAYFENAGGGMLTGVPLLLPSIRPVNRYAGTGLFSDAPLCDPGGTSPPTVTNVFDDDLGYVTRVAFNASIGSTASNRVTIKAIGNAVAVGDIVAIPVFMRAAAPRSVIVLPVGDTQLTGPQLLQLNTDWQRVVLYGKAAFASPSGYDVYIYPSAADSPVVFVSRIMGAWTPAGADPLPINDVMRRGLYNNMRKRVVAPAIPASGTWRVGDVVDFITPTAGGFIGAVCVTAGTPGTWKNFAAIAA